ncbi:hypothetical protein H4R26_001598 [Coemansia thaxteri]|uniref:Pentatricopeptide repeat-containing protein-mitochondrial domain-containing protein n=1 Tax=Coemansia thaxteri TaxID=2663907 RepID=A0A9W8EL01_9FUNG|nr:hypothetical protein H4R26_001598 [Coemansia thaxteri]
MRKLGRLLQRVGYSTAAQNAQRLDNIPALVQQIVHPSEYRRIEITKEVAQQARLSGKDIGQSLRADAQQQRARARTQLDGVFAAMTGNKGAGAGSQPVAGSHAFGPADYAAVLEAYLEVGSAAQCVRVLQEMRHAGHVASAAQLSSVLAVATGSRAAAAVFAVGEEMQAVGVAADAAFDSSVIAALAGSRQVEFAYAHYSEARARGRILQRDAYAQLIEGLADIGECDLALEVVRDTRGASVALTAPTFVALLRGAGRRMHYEAYRAAYAHVAAVGGAQLTEGDCCAGLAVAARAADAALGADLVRRLRANAYPVNERHMEPLFEALVRASRWPPAFRALAAMRDAGFATTPASLRVLTRALTLPPDCAEAAVDAAHVALLACRSTAPRAVDSTTLNAMLAGLSLSGCVEAAADRLHRWYGPTMPRSVDSYAAVLRGCVLRKNTAVAERALAQCIDVDHLTPSKLIYALMIDISLRQFNYEDAFVYLDAMRALGYTPDWRTYSSIVRRCAAVRDPRAATAIEQMKADGHPITRSLSESVETYARKKAPSAWVETKSRPADNADDDSWMFKI